MTERLCNIGVAKMQVDGSSVSTFIIHTPWFVAHDAKRKLQYPPITC
jgi:hypothetical protein